MTSIWLCPDFGRHSSSFGVTPSISHDDLSGVLSNSLPEEHPALERLPTYDSSSKDSIGLRGEKDIDGEKLWYEEKKNLIERLVNNFEDNEKLLLKLKSRIERVGLEIPTIEVRFKDLKIEAEAYVGLFNCLRNFRSQKQHLKILDTASGIIKPGRLTLLLGPPSSGKTTLLLALAGKLDPDLKVSGGVTYNGHGMDEFVPQRIASYISQHDVHIPTLTVRETLEFSARCQGVGCRRELLAELSRREKATNIKPDPDVDMFMKAMATEGKETIVTEYILKILGLDVCADTFVGNQMVRGISGGQKKRVTAGEMLVGPSRVLFMDQISTGLDSLTAFQIVNSLRQYVRILKETAVISLLQPAPETYDLFDDIILLSDAQIIYQGPRDHVLEFFDYMGFRCPERTGTANFLQEVALKKEQQRYWAHEDEPYRFITAKEFSEAFQSFHIGQKISLELLTSFDRSNGHPAALTTRKYGVGKKELFGACLSREWLLMKRNSSLYVFKFFQIFVASVLAMTVFSRAQMHKGSANDGAAFMGALYFTISRILLNEISELSLTVMKLLVLYKQRDLHFFPAWAMALSQWILDIPVAAVVVGLLVFPTYYAIGFDPNIERLFKQFLLLFLVYQMAAWLFRFIAAATRNMILAQTFGMNAFLLLTALGGFVLSRDNVKSWWIWGYWMSPLMYAQNGLAVNEFLGKSWSHTHPNSTETIGVSVLKSQGLFPCASWYWLSVGALIGWTVFYNVVYALALTFLGPIEKPHACKLELEDKQRNDKSQVSTSELQYRGRALFLHEKLQTSEQKQRGMILPFKKHFVTFAEIRYSIDMPKEMMKRGAAGDKLQILNGVTGAFRPGVLTALMGVSGAGKTTLLDVLAGRKTGGCIEGDIRISGWPKKQESFARISGYCEQNDVHSPHVTVYESLIYSAWLQLSPAEVDPITRQIFIEEVMELLELTPLRTMLVGLPGVSGLSTEQRRRLTIAVELVANPSIIFMDEPTSGLDARAAGIVMRTVRNAVDTGRTVVCIIHQPSIEIFHDFDELLLLKCGGEAIYVGPLGHGSCHLVKFFEAIEGVPKIKDGCNPAAWMLDVTTPANELALGVDFAQIYGGSDQFRRTKALIEELNRSPQDSQQLRFPAQFSQIFFMQFLACLWKQHRSYWHNSLYTLRRLCVAAVMAVLLGTMFWDLGSKVKTKEDLFNAMGSMFVAVMYLGVQNSSAVQPLILVERTVFYRERAAAMYSAIPYALAQVAIEIPYGAMQALLYVVIIYAMIGFEWSVGKFFWYLFFTFFSFLYFTFFGMMMIAMSPDQSVALIMSSFFFTLWNLFAGFVIPNPMIPIWWRWYCWACPVAWSMNGLFSSQYGDIKDVLDDGSTVQQFLKEYYGFRHDFLGVVSGSVIGFALLFATLFAFFVKTFNFQKR